MAGLLYLPRLYVYHNDKRYLSDTDTTFLLMEYRLLKYIMYPATIITYVFGLILIYENIHILFEKIFFIKVSFSTYSIFVSYIFINSLQRF